MRTTLAVLIVTLLCSPGARGAGPPKYVASVDSLLSDSVGAGAKVVYMDFWASWCVPCRKSFPWMESLSKQYQKQGLEVVAVNVDKDKSAAQEFLQNTKSPLDQLWGKAGVPVHVVYDPDGKLAKRFRLDVMPTSFIYGRDGDLKEEHRGFNPQDTLHLDSLVVALLKEGKP
jgi:thiol-disulfide isomerase/thioredoxin